METLKENRKQIKQKAKIMEKQNQLFSEEEICYINKKLSDYKRNLNTDYFNAQTYIVEIGDYTVGADGCGIINLVNVKFPQQFTKEKVEEILNYTFKTLNGYRAAVKVFNARVWYLKKIDELETLIKLIEVYQKF